MKYFVLGQMVTTRNGSKSLLLGKYYYNRRQIAKNQHWRWYCARYHRGCKASVITTEELYAIKYIGDHCHLPTDNITSGGRRGRSTSRSEEEPLNLFINQNITSTIKKMFQ